MAVLSQRRWRCQFRCVEFAGNSVFGAEERHELYAVRMREHVNGAAALRIHSGLIGDQTDALAAQRREVLFFEDVNAGLGVFGGLRWRR